MNRELAISLWDVYRITRLHIVEETYDEVFPNNKLILDKKLPVPLGELFRIWSHLLMWTHRPKFIEWVKDFIPKSFDNMPL